VTSSIIPDISWRLSLCLLRMSVEALCGFDRRHVSNGRRWLQELQEPSVYWYLAMWEVVDTIASMWTATILAYGAIAGALILARWTLDQIRTVRNSLGQQPSRN
jgi:hypothetical protein